MRRLQSGVGAMDRVFAFAESVKEFLPYSYPPSFVPTKILEQTLEGIRETQEVAQRT